tara:strand:- start:8764 stop:10122 length:1359 start_codon:yes stop_codon:yes gene_type:complete
MFSKKSGLKESNSRTHILANIFWLGADKLLRLGLTLLVTIYVARYLGPEQFGILNFATALVAVFTVISALGFQGIVVRELVVNPADSGKILASAMMLMVIAAVLSYLLLIMSITFLEPDNALSQYMVAVLGTTLLFKCSSIYKYWFESQIRSKYVVWAENAVFLLIVGFKLLLVYLQAPLVAFAWAVWLEALLTALLLRTTFSRAFANVPYVWRHNWGIARRLLKESWPLVLSAAAWIIYARVDQIMIAQLSGDAEVGLYSAAVRISEVSNFLPGIIAFSIMPAILPLLKTDESVYRQRLQQLFDAALLLMLAFALLVTFTASWFMPVLFGTAFTGAAEILVIHVWCGIFSAFAVISARHLINIGMQTVLMQRNLLGLALNVPLNWWLIPQYGGVGAAWASLIAILCVNYLFDVFHPVLRVMFVQKTKAMLFLNMRHNLREIMNLMNKSKSL